MSHIYLVRHGQSAANVDRTVYRDHPNHSISLTESGVRQSVEVGEKLAKIMNAQSDVCIWHSPFKRCRDAVSYMAESFSNHSYDVVEEPFLAEINLGLFDGLLVEERKERFPAEYALYCKTSEHQGEYWARMPMGESPMDVDVRLESLRSQIKLAFSRGIQHAVIVSHGLVLRILIMRYLKMTYEEFQRLPNPKPGSILMLKQQGDVLEDLGYQ